MNEFMSMHETWATVKNSFICRSFNSWEFPTSHLRLYTLYLNFISFLIRLMKLSKVQINLQQIRRC
jgi:hypothetical protein